MLLLLLLAAAWTGARRSGACLAAPQLRLALQQQWVYALWQHCAAALNAPVTPPQCRVAAARRQQQRRLWGRQPLQQQQQQQEEEEEEEET